MEQRAASTEESAQRIELTKTLFDTHETLSLGGCVAGEPWVAIAYFIEDEPRAGSLDMCASILLSPQRRAAFDETSQIAFVVAGGEPARWFQGTGSLEIVSDEADALAINKRIADKAAAAGPFLERVDATPVRIHVERLKVTDLDADPPVAEFTFA